MSSPELVPLVVAVLFVLVVVGTGVVVARRRSRPGDLGERLAAELERTPEPTPARSTPAPEAAQRDAVQRPAVQEARPAPRPLQLRPLPADARQRYLTAWEGVQGRFADAPVLALSEADALLTRLLSDRGLPTEDGRGALSAQQAQVLEAFRTGHAIEQRNSSVRADEEEVRQGMLRFREVFAALVVEGDGEPYPQAGQKVAQPGNR